MIYLGVNMINNQFKIVALDDNFNFLAKKAFRFNNAYDVNIWIRMLKTESSELTKWYFDELEFSNKACPKRAIKKFDRLHKIFLVNHRKLIETTSVFECYAAYKFKKIFNVDTTFVLAAAEKIIDDRFRRRYVDDYMYSMFKIPF